MTKTNTAARTAHTSQRIVGKRRSGERSGKQSEGAVHFMIYIAARNIFQHGPVMRLHNMIPLSAAALGALRQAHGFVAPSSPSSSAAAAAAAAAATAARTNGAQSPHGMTATSKETATDLQALAKPGTADVPWSDLGFEFRPTKSHLKMVWSEDTGAWGPPELVDDSPYINVHIGATALHYGQSCFEGLKAFAHEDDSVHIFRPDENAKR